MEVNQLYFGYDPYSIAQTIYEGEGEKPVQDTTVESSQAATENFGDLTHAFDMVYRMLISGGDDKAEEAQAQDNGGAVSDKAKAIAASADAINGGV